MTQRPAQEAQEIVLVANAVTGQTEIRVPTAANPSPESQRLAEALAVLADPDAPEPPPDPWTDTSPDARRARWLDDLDAARERQGITTREWGALLEAFGQAASARGWFGDDGQQELQALIRARLGPGGRG